MSGESESVESDLETMERDLAETLARKGLILIPKPEVDEYMHMTYSRLSSLPPGELAMIGVELARYSYYLQTVIGFFLTRMTICRRQIEKRVGHKLVEYVNIYGKDEKWIAAIADDDVASRWKDLEHRAYLLFKNLEYMPNRVNEMMDMITMLEGNRRRLDGKI
jgi:hypothetical protein